MCGKARGRACFIWDFEGKGLLFVLVGRGVTFPSAKPKTTSFACSAGQTKLVTELL